MRGVNHTGKQIVSLFINETSVEKPEAPCPIPSSNSSVKDSLICNLRQKSLKMAVAKAVLLLNPQANSFPARNQVVKMVQEQFPLRSRPVPNPNPSPGPKTPRP